MDEAKADTSIHIFPWSQFHLHVFKFFLPICVVFGTLPQILEGSVCVCVCVAWCVIHKGPQESITDGNNGGMC